jgi:hypothetical protein
MVFVDMIVFDHISVVMVILVDMIVFDHIDKVMTILADMTVFVGHIAAVVHTVSARVYCIEQVGCMFVVFVGWGSLVFVLELLDYIVLVCSSAEYFVDFVVGLIYLTPRSVEVLGQVVELVQWTVWWDLYLF